MLIYKYKNLYSELLPDGGVVRTTNLGTWLEIALLRVIFYYKFTHFFIPADAELRG